MAKTLDYAGRKWAEKTSGKGAVWKQRVESAEPAYVKGVATFLGVSEGNVTKGSAYASGVGAVTAEDFNSAISGKQDKYKEKLKIGLTS